jgi:hypothetical protein
MVIYSWIVLENILNLGVGTLKKIAEVGLTHEPCPLRQNHVIIHSGVGA